MRDAASEVSGTEPAVAGASYWADAAFIASAGIRTVIFGRAARGRTPSRSG